MINVYIYVWNGSAWVTPLAVLGTKFSDRFDRGTWEGLIDLNMAYANADYFQRVWPQHHFLVIDGNIELSSLPPP